MPDSTRGMRFRVETACDGYENLIPSDVPDAIDDVDAYLAGAAEAARQIRSALEEPPGEEVPTLVEEFAPCNERYSKVENFRGVKINLGIARCTKRKGHPAEIEHGDA